MTAEFLQNFWYAAAWSSDIGMEPISRVIIGHPVVLYRTGTGEVVALRDVCPHRFAKLSRGTIVGDDLECGYHGLRFGPSGTCVFNPHGSDIPERAQVETFTVAEADGMIWVWGNPKSEPDLAKLPRFPMLESDEFTVTPGETLEMPLSYELITDNLMDLSHVAFVHSQSLGSDALVPGETRVRVEDDAIYSERLGRNGMVGPDLAKLMNLDLSDRVDYWADVRWTPPATFVIFSGTVAAGRPREEGFELSSVQVLTPSSENQTYYFFKHFRNFSQGDEALTQEIVKSASDAFTLEDEPMIASVADNMGQADFWELKPVILECDAAALRVRRRREKLLRLEGESGQDSSA